MKAAIRHVSLASLGKMGCLLGTVAAFLPSLLCGVLAVLLARLVQGWLQSWQTLTITVLGRQIASIDLVQRLGLDGLLHLVQTITAASVPVLLLAVLGLALASGAVLALITILVGLAYNLLAAATGGIVVELAAVKDRTQE
jgi:hypothetical protein